MVRILPYQLHTFFGDQEARGHDIAWLETDKSGLITGS